MASLPELRLNGRERFAVVLIYSAHDTRNMSLTKFKVTNSPTNSNKSFQHKSSNQPSAIHIVDLEFILVR